MLRVLYVDDDRVQALLFAEACRFAPGVAVEAAGSGAEALELAPGFDPQLVVIDLHLPDTDGYALLPRLRTALPRHVQAVLCTADDADRVHGLARAAGYDACWTKPIVPAALSAMLAACAAGDATSLPG